MTVIPYIVHSSFFLIVQVSYTQKYRLLPGFTLLGK
jgi:hypothetical protein